jgi:ribose 1,5-bisphosphate isomerase
LVQRWSEGAAEFQENDLQAVRRGLADQAEGLSDLSRQAVEQVAARTAAEIGPGKTLITHSLSATVVAVFRRLADQGVRAIVSESRPLNEGCHLVGILSGLGVPTRLITDAQIGLCVSDADLALVGADSLLPDGSLVNKVGTYLLALAARDRGVPFWVCSESLKQRDETLPALKLERMDPAELGAPDLPGVQIDNVYFDVTPARLISAWFDEEGVRHPAP